MIFALYKNNTPKADLCIFGRRFERSLVSFRGFRNSRMHYTGLGTRRCLILVEVWQSLNSDSRDVHTSWANRSTPVKVKT